MPSILRMTSLVKKGTTRMGHQLHSGVWQWRCFELLMHRYVTRELEAFRVNMSSRQTSLSPYLAGTGIPIKSARKIARSQQLFHWKIFFFYWTAAPRPAILRFNQSIKFHSLRNEILVAVLLVVKEWNSWLINVSFQGLCATATISATEPGRRTAVRISGPSARTSNHLRLLRRSDVSVRRIT